MARATSIQLYSQITGSYSTDDASYCGCWFVPCPDDDPRIADLEAMGLGRALDQDGTVTRAFFFADEIDDMLIRAERETGCCIAVAEWEYGA